MKFQANVGRVDQIIRYVIALGFLTVAIITSMWSLIIVSVVLVFTALFKTCGLYRLIGINTCKIEGTKK